MCNAKDYKQIIIDDQKKTIHRLQDECTEKTDAIIALGEQLKAKEQECEELRSIRDSWISKSEQETKIKEFYQYELDRLKAKNDELEKLKQTLDEIKEICNPYRDMPIYEFVVILRKIEEMENETTAR